MSEPLSPEQRAEALVDVHQPQPGGPTFVRLRGPAEPILLGPYENPAVAADDARRLRQFVAAVIHEARAASPRADSGV